MFEFKVSAPGKIILYGEHAVVYGKTAVAASLDLRTTVKFAELPKSSDSENVIKIEFSDIKLFVCLPTRIFLNFFFNGTFDYQLAKPTMRSFVKEFVDSIEYVIGNSYSEDVFKQKQSSLQAFFLLLLCVANEESINIKEASFHVHMSTELTISSGMGSSASFAVSLAACFLYWSLLQKGKQCDTFNKLQLEKISKYALWCEKIMHESPSGIDNSVCTYGSIIKFQKGMVDTLSHVPNLKILLVNSKVTRNTKDQVKGVVHLKELYPTMMNSVLDGIDALSDNAWQTLKKISNEDQDLESTKQGWHTLSKLTRMNQGLLNALHVSHPKLEMICATAWAHSYAGKLTGAGGGGYAYILLPPDADDESIKNLSGELEEKGFQVTMANLGCGVKIEH